MFLSPQTLKPSYGPVRDCVSSDPFAWRLLLYLVFLLSMTPVFDFDYDALKRARGTEPVGEICGELNHCLMTIVLSQIYLAALATTCVNKDMFGIFNTGESGGCRANRKRHRRHTVSIYSSRRSNSDPFLLRVRSREHWPDVPIFSRVVCWHLPQQYCERWKSRWVFFQKNKQARYANIAPHTQKRTLENDVRMYQ